MRDDKKGQEPSWPSQDLFHLVVNESQGSFIPVVSQQLPHCLPFQALASDPSQVHSRPQLKLSQVGHLIP